MIEEPHHYIEDILQFRKITKEKRIEHIKEIEKQIDFYSKVKSGKIKVRDNDLLDINTMLKYNNRLLSIMKIVSFEMGD